MAQRIRLLTAFVVTMTSTALFPACAPDPGSSGGEATQNDANQLVTVRVGGERFFVEPALDQPTRIQGLSGRTEIARDGGMLFVFPTPARQGFVMRDCPVPIDIIFVADNGRIDAAHAMQVDPRREGESDIVYERRLKRYKSDGRVSIAVEFAGGTIERLNLQPGQRVSIEGLEDLKARVE